VRKNRAETFFSSARIAKVIYATRAMTIDNHAVHVVESYASFVTKRFVIVLISLSVLNAEC